MLETSTTSVQKDRDGREPGTSEDMIRLGVPTLPLGHDSSKTLEFAAERMVSKEKQAVQELRGALHR